MIPFLQLTPGEDAAVVRAAIERVVTRGWFVLGPSSTPSSRSSRQRPPPRTRSASGRAPTPWRSRFERWGSGRGDEVITSPLSAAYSALAIMMAGARPVFADIDPDRLTLDPAATAAAVTPRTAAIMPVHLYGQPADMARLGDVATRHHLAIVEDCCQAHLATCGGRPVGSFGVAAAYSFYPTKNLGALGDGGAITTSDPYSRRVRSACGTAARPIAITTREFGVNSRLDELQAAVLRARLHLLPCVDGTPARPGARVSRGVDGERHRRRAAGMRSRSRVSPVSRPQCGPRRSAGAAAGVWDRDADSLPGPDPTTAGPRVAGSGPVREREPRLRRDLLAAALPAACRATPFTTSRERSVRADARAMQLTLQVAQLLLVAWLPGAAALPAAVVGRDRRAALDAEERLFWAVVLSLAMSLSIVIAMAVLHRYSFTRLLISDALSS